MITVQKAGFLKKILERFSTEGLYFKSNVAQIKWNAPRKVAILKWIKKPKGEAFRKACVKNLELAEVHQSRIWYENRTAFSGLLEEDQRWFDQNFGAKLKERGIKRMAFLLSEKDFSRKKHQQWVYGTNPHGIEYRYFDEVIDAVSWLLELRKVKSL